MSFAGINRQANNFEASRKEDLEPPILFRSNSHSRPRQRLQRSSAFVTKTGSEYLPCKRRLLSCSVKYVRQLSVTNLLEQAECQRASYANLFPFVDKDKYTKNVAMSLNDLKDVECRSIILNEQEITAEDFGKFRSNILKENDNSKAAVAVNDDKIIAIKKRDNDKLIPLNDTKEEFVVTNMDLRKVSKRRESIPLIILHDSVTPPVDYRRGLTDVWCGVNIDYMVLSNKLKISVEKFGTLLSEYGTSKRVFLFAKVCLMPGNLQRQKVNVISGMEARLMKPSVFFRGISGNNLVQMEIGVTLYLKRGFLRKSKLIHEWSIPMAEVDLIESQTAWKQISGHL